MKIKNLKISNWRSIKNIEIEAQDLMVIIGQNNHGKSNLLSAILFFFGEIKYQDLDFNHGSTELYTEITFDDLDESDETTFKKYLTSEKQIIVRKTAYIGGSFDYKGFIENPVDEWLQESNASAYTKRELATTFAFHPFLPTTGRISKQQIINAQTAYIEQNRDALSFNFELEQTNFLGLKTVAKGIFGEVYFVPAVKEATEDFSSKESSAFGKLYSEVITAMSESNSEWKDTRENLSNLFATLNRVDPEGNQNDNRPEQLAQFEKELSKELSMWGAEVDIEVTPPDIDNVFRANTQVWVNDGVRTDIKRKGHGLQRALTIALIQVIANRASLRNENSEDEKQSSRKASNSKYFIFEEPELYLHPQAQRLLFDSLIGLSETGSQVILCTHSSALIDVERYKSIYILFKENDTDGSRVRQCKDELFIGDGKKDFNLSYWINPDRGELFFAKKVVLVEGPTDKTVIPSLAKNLGVFSYEYTFIDCGSKTSIPLYMRLLNRFSIPYVAVYDKDHQAIKGTDAIAAADTASKQIEDEIETTLGSSVIFENDIEEELGLSAGGKSKPYVALMHVSDPSFALAESLKQKILEIYDTKV